MYRQENMAKAAQMASIVRLYIPLPSHENRSIIIFQCYVAPKELTKVTLLNSIYQSSLLHLF